MIKAGYKDISWDRKIAYAIGLLVTDGNLSPDGRHFDFTSNDKDLIETFKQCLSLTNRIGRKRSGYTGRKEAFRVQFGNTTLYRQLLQIGLMPKKSKQMGVLQIPDAYFFDFLRGHLDGDGSIKKYNDPVYPRSRRLYTTFLSASPTHAHWLKERINDLLHIEGRVRKGRRVYILTYSKHASLLLLHHIYNTSDTMRLERKFRIAQEFISMPRW